MYLRIFRSIHTFINILNILNCSSLKIVWFFCLRSSFRFFVHVSSFDWTTINIILEWFVRWVSLLIENGISEFSRWEKLTWYICHIYRYFVIVFWNNIICIFRFERSINLIFSPFHNFYTIFIQYSLRLQRVLRLANFNYLFVIAQFNF